MGFGVTAVVARGDGLKEGFRSVERDLFRSELRARILDTIDPGTPAAAVDVLGECLNLFLSFDEDKLLAVGDIWVKEGFRFRPFFSSCNFCR